jgi:hypothetical protein
MLLDLFLYSFDCSFLRSSLYPARKKLFVEDVVGKPGRKHKICFITTPLVFVVQLGTLYIDPPKKSTKL